MDGRGKTIQGTRPHFSPPLRPLRNPLRTPRFPSFPQFRPRPCIPPPHRLFTRAVSQALMGLIGKPVRFRRGPRHCNWELSSRNAHWGPGSSRFREGWGSGKGEGEGRSRSQETCLRSICGEREPAPEPRRSDFPFLPGPAGGLPVFGGLRPCQGGASCRIPRLVPFPFSPHSPSRLFSPALRRQGRCTGPTTPTFKSSRASGRARSVLYRPASSSEA